MAGRGVAISGYEDHSLDVAGRDHVVTYDDSNVFIARNGQINANTGDTDSAGLNVIDVTGSVVHSGNQNEDAGRTPRMMRTVTQTLKHPSHPSR